jgi:hypothetical protein
MKPGPKAQQDEQPIERLPVEWDFRWVGSEEEADEVYMLEFSREVIRQAEKRLKGAKEKQALTDLVEAMVLPVNGLPSPKALAASERLKKASFVGGVIMTYAGYEAGALCRLPPAIKRMKQIQASAGRPKGSFVDVTPLSSGETFRAFSFSGETYLVVKIPKGATSRMAKDDFSVWADANLPAGTIRVGGRPDLPSVKLLRLAFFRFHVRWAHPRPFAGFAVAVQSQAKGEMSPLFSDFGNCCYAPFMNQRAKQPKPSNWSEYVSAAKAELEPFVAEVVEVVKSMI